MKLKQLFFLTGSLLLLYCTARAVSLSMTHDESSTMMVFAPRTFWQVVTNEPPDANNHIFNTLLVQLFTSIDNNKVLARLPNLLAAGLYFFFGIRLLLQLFANGWLQALAFALLFFNPYLLEFFALARGYGLSIGFMMVSLYFAHRFTREGRLSTLAWSGGMAVLACYSSLAMLNYFVALIGAVNLHLLYPFHRPDIPRWRKANGLLLGFSLLLGGLIFLPVRKLVQSEKLYYGGQSGFLKDTYVSLAEGYLGPEFYLGDMTLTLFAGTGLLLFLLAVSRNMMEGFRGQATSPAAFFTTILLLMAASTLLQFQLFGTRFLMGRTALLFFPVGALVLAFLFHGSAHWLKLALLIPICFHFLIRLNVKYVRDWWYDRYTEQAFHYLAGRVGKEEVVRLGSQWLFTPTLTYYIMSEGYQNILTPALDYEIPPGKTYDYYYLEAREAGKLHPDYILEKKFNGYYLMKLPEKR